jgi:hypothetical protein
MVTDEPLNCWEFMKCPKERRDKCSIYKMDSGKECWFISSPETGCLGSKEKGGCFNCPWFKKNNP